LQYIQGEVLNAREIIAKGLDSKLIKKFLTSVDKVCPEVVKEVEKPKIVEPEPIEEEKERDPSPGVKSVSEKSAAKSEVHDIEGVPALKYY
jgi:hypothetical protein